MDFRILGSLEVVDSDRRIRLPSGRARALLALLTLHAGQPLTADRLIDELWGEDPPATAATVVHGLVSRLRRALEPHRVKGTEGHILETVGAGYRLAIAPTAIDAHRFTDLVDQARSASPEIRASILTTALELWRGPALADFVYEPFAQRAIAALEERRIEAVELRFEAELAVGRDAQLVADLQTAIAAHPYRERLRSSLMIALYRGGRQAEALEAYRSTRRFLLDEMGLEPSPSLRELEQSILRHDSSLEREAIAAREGAKESSWLPHERRRVTVVVVDVAPETDPTIDAEVVSRAGANATAVASDVLERSGGRVERSVGERLVAFFGFPVTHEDDPLRAVRTALDLRTAVHQLADGSTQPVVYRSRVGIETGEVIVGPGMTLADAVRGPAVSAAARLQHLAADGEILVGPGARRVLSGAAILDPIRATPGQIAQSWRVLEVVVGAPPIPRTFEAPMFGRQSELTRLRIAFRRALRTGHIAPVWIIGEAGIGKSRIAREVTASLGDDARAMVLRCPPPGDAMGFFPIRQAVVETAGIDGWRALHDLLAEAYDGSHAVPTVADAIALRSPPAKPQELLAPLQILLEAIARQHPLVVIVEDLHWADPAFRETTERLATEVEGPILLLGLARPDPPHDASLSGEVVALNPLDNEDIEHLVIERAGTFVGGALPRIVDLSQGNPLFAEQLLAAIDDGDEHRIPPSLAGLLSMRIDRLGPGERDVLRVASIAGVDVETDVVEALLPDEGRRFLDRHLETLEQRRLIERVGPRRLRFAHPLIQMAAYQTMTRDDRTRLEHALASQVNQPEARTLLTSIESGRRLPLRSQGRLY